MTGLITALNSTVDKLIKLLEFISIFLLSISICITFINVVCRYIFRYPIFWADELATLILIAIVFLPVAMIEKTIGHLKVNILFQLLGDKMKIFGEYLKVLATIITGAYFFGVAVPVVYENYKLSINTIALKLPTAFSLSVIPIAFLTLTIVNLLFLIRLLKFQK
jgi:TRAP-type C4-dicarboxylate transport system permease small subunit